MTTRTQPTPTQPNPSAKRGKRAKGWNPIALILLMALLSSGALLGGYLLLLLPKRSPELIGAGSSRNSLPERIYLSFYLAANAEALHETAEIAREIPFTISPGENASLVAARLLELGLIRNEELLRYYLKYNGLDNKIDAGSFLLNSGMSIAEIAQALTQALPSDFAIRLWEGWRMEQMAEAFGAYPSLRINGVEFAQLANNGDSWRAQAPFLMAMPIGASLEGYLFPDTYNFTPETTAEDAIRVMLENFGQKVTPDVMQKFAAQGLNLHQAVTLASIIEREAVVDDERPIIAQVFLNRLAIGMTLDADPTTQYALAKAGDWWPQLRLDPRTVNHAYNTYLVSGLPPGPIANPGLQSLLAVANPSGDSYLYFRATCAQDGGRHAFANTLEEHIANGCN
ncbi:MAG TPA: endolytic transglycosylase MltG [Anaerolineales bacterium]|nr:endolytic transglycosylase MltG [Anaerolineales bacterium]